MLPAIVDKFRNFISSVRNDDDDVFLYAIFVNFQLVASPPPLQDTQPQNIADGIKLPPPRYTIPPCFKIKATPPPPRYLFFIGSYTFEKA